MTYIFGTSILVGHHTMCIMVCSASACQSLRCGSSPVVPWVHGSYKVCIICILIHLFISAWSLLDSKRLLWNWVLLIFAPPASTLVSSHTRCLANAEWRKENSMKSNHIIWLSWNRKMLCSPICRRQVSVPSDRKTSFDPLGGTHLDSPLREKVSRTIFPGLGLDI